MSFASQRGHGNDYQPLADINVTPLVDVMLVLLIVFMITAPMLTAGVKVNLPQAKAAQPLNPKEPIVIVVSKDGKVSFGPDEIPQDRLVAAIQAKIGDDPAHIIHVRGDKDASYGNIIAIMDLLATNGLTHLALISDTHHKADKAKTEARQPASETTGPGMPLTTEPHP